MNYLPEKPKGFIRPLLYAMGCSLSLPVGCIIGVLAVAMLIIMFVAAIFGFFNPQQNSIGGDYLPPAGAQVAPYYGTPSPFIPATLAPTRTPIPPAPTPPNIPDCGIGTPVPGETPDPEATQTAYQECQAEHDRVAATATAGYRAWAATATAYPTETPPPPTPEGVPNGAPISSACTPGYTGCAADAQGRRILTQEYGCTEFPEVGRGWNQWCQNNTHQGDPRWNRSGAAPDGYTTGHEGIDFDTGHQFDSNGYYHGEWLWNTLNGRIADRRAVIPEVGDWQRGFGTYIAVEDTSHHFRVIYGHMSAIAEAYYYGPVPNPNSYQYGQDLGRGWQVGDYVVTTDQQGRPVLLGYTGYTGYTSRGRPLPGGGQSDGEHLHYQINLDGISVDPWPYMMRRPTDPLPNTPVPYRLPGG